MDEQLLLLINREWTHPAADRLMAAVSSFDLWLPVVGVIILVLAIRGGFRARAFLLTAAAIVGITDGAVCNPLKRLIDRPRPHQALAGIRIVDLAKAKPLRLFALGKPIKIKHSQPASGDVEGRSLPSSHTANTMAFACVAARFFPARGWWAFALPLLVGYSRIYTGSHWPSDVPLSAALGAGAALALLPLAAWLWRRFGGRWLPQVYARHPALLGGAR